MAEAKFELITRRLQEVLGGDLMKAILTEGRTPKCYWGRSAATSRMQQRVLRLWVYCRNCTHRTTCATPSDL